jgi:hypothetical protein
MYPWSAGELCRAPNAIGEPLAASTPEITDAAEPQLKVVFLCHDKGYEATLRSSFKVLHNAPQKSATSGAIGGMRHRMPPQKTMCRRHFQGLREALL